MDLLSTPAGRLHSLLAQFFTEAKPNRTVEAVWAIVLEVEPPDVPQRLTTLAPLLPAIKAAIARDGDPTQQAIYNRWHPQWATPVLLSQQTMATPAQGLLDDAAVEVLGGVAATLARGVTAEGAIPEPDALSSATDAVRAALAAVEADTDLPDRLRRLVAERLNDLIHALEHVRIGGPDAVDRALDGLLGATERSGKHATSRSVSRAKAAAVAAWLLFSSGPTLLASLEAWPDLLQIAGVEVVHGEIVRVLPGELGPAPEPAAEDEQPPQTDDDAGAG